MASLLLFRKIHIVSYKTVYVQLLDEDCTWINSFLTSLGKHCAIIGFSSAMQGVNLVLKNLHHAKYSFFFIFCMVLV